MNTTVIIAIIGITLSILSFALSCWVWWTTKGSPPKIVGAFRYTLLWSFFEQQKGSVNEYLLVPSFWLLNLGAKPLLAEEMRLVICPDGTEAFELYPMHTVPAEAIHRPNTFSDFDTLRLGDAPASGFVIANSGNWNNNHAFPLTPLQRKALTGIVHIHIEIRALGAKEFKRYLSQKLNFSAEDFSWAKWLEAGGPLPEYYYSVDR